MHWEQSHRLFNRVTLALGIKRRLTFEECYELLHLSEAIIEYGRMMLAYQGHSAAELLVEIPELARRFRETPRTIKDGYYCWKTWVALSMFVREDIGS